MIPSWLETFWTIIQSSIQSGFSVIEDLFNYGSTLFSFVNDYILKIFPNGFIIPLSFFLSFLVVLLSFKIAKTILDAIPFA